MRKIKITECPRDAMQGIKDFIPTTEKIEYLNLLLKVGYYAIDFGSFVSPKAIPQLADTTEVLKELDSSDSKSKLLAIIANERGAETASKENQVNIVGFPFSISEEFQKRNTNSTREESFERVKNIQSIINPEQHLRIYLSMAFGNPYGEDWNLYTLIDWAKRLSEIGISELVLSDTTGMANPETIGEVYREIGRNSDLKNIEINCHFHSHPSSWKEKIDTAQKYGCKGFDSAIKGIGGCPMANDDLVGNIATEKLLNKFYDIKSEELSFPAFQDALIYADKLFSKYH